MQPLKRYLADLQAGLVAPDAGQRRVIEQLDALYDAITAESENAESENKASWRGKLWRSMFGKPDSKALAPKGIYLWGGVGRGKTYLMDMFYSCLPSGRKHRTHFYRFMQQVHKMLTRRQGEADPLQHVAASLAAETDVICFDEFLVSDIGDAMILAGLLEALFARGVILVTTSNVHPDLLYENGLQRERFLPAIELIKQHSSIVEIGPGIDHRLERLMQSRLYLSPLDDSVDDILCANFRDLAPDYLKVEKDQLLMILERGIRTRFCADDVVWFEFPELCEGPRSAFDYVEIARLFHALILGDVPQMTDINSEATRRFISLVDELYDRRVKLILAAAVGLPELYTGSQLAFEFERTRSRLAEMQSHEYLSAGHRA